MKKKIIVLLILVLTAAAVIFFINKKTSSDELTLYGNIEIRQADLSFQVSGKIGEMLKEEGDSVQKGELVALLDDRDYASNFNKAQAEVLRTKALYEDAKTNYERKYPLCSDSTISKLECDNLVNSKDRAEAEYKASLANETIAENDLSYTKLYAPDDGIITVRVQEPGTIAAKGQIVYTLSKSKPVWIRAYINETDLGNIKYDMKARVLTDSIDPKTKALREYEGRIGYISPVAEFTPKTVQSTDLRTNLVYRIRVYIDEPDDFLRQGMPVTVKVDLK